MKIKLLIISAILVIAAGCSTTVPINTTLPVNVNLYANDLSIGKKITHTIPYNKKDPNMLAIVYREALVKSGYDFILLPQYDINEALFKSTITIKGYGANLKNR